MIGYTEKAITTFIQDELTSFKRQKHELEIKKVEAASQERIKQRKDEK